MSDKLSWNDVLAIMLQENIRDSVEHDISDMVPEDDNDFGCWEPQNFDDNAW